MVKQKTLMNCLIYQFKYHRVIMNKILIKLKKHTEYTDYIMGKSGGTLN